MSTNSQDPFVPTSLSSKASHLEASRAHGGARLCSPPLVWTPSPPDTLIRDPSSLRNQDGAARPPSRLCPVGVPPRLL